MIRNAAYVALALVQILVVAGTSLNYRGRWLREIPREVFEAKDLEELDLSGNRLTELPEEIGNLSMLKKLDISDNELTELPESIGDLSMLRELDLSGNKLTALPESIGDLPMLQLLHIMCNELKALPEAIGDLSMLKDLCLYHNQLTALPETIGRLEMLQKLYLRRNQLTALPETIGRLERLQKLYLDNNQLTALPEAVGCLVSLQELYLNSNQLTVLPEAVGCLVSLQKLCLHRNKLTALPEAIGRLVSLQELYLDNNQLAALPEAIGRLEMLQELYLDNNQLAALPEAIGRLEMLQKFYLDNNQLTALPEAIGRLVRLKDIRLDNNQLTALPVTIGYLERLQMFYLRYNQLTSLPHTMAGLHDITMLDLRNNPLVERGEGDTLGWRDLRERLGDRVVLSQNELAGPVTVINEDDVYRRLREDTLHWNIERLRHIIVDSVTPPTLSAHDLLAIWTQRLAEHAPPTTDGRDMASYIKTVYGIDENAFQGWKMYTKSLAETQALLEAVLVRLRDCTKNARAYVPELCEALRWCPDRQKACLAMVYRALYGGEDRGTFESFVEQRVGELKSIVLDVVVMPGQATQNVHVLNTWRHILRDRLGIRTEYESRMGTYDQDIYGGSVGNVLDVFYRKFTPLYVIRKLAEEINESEKWLVEAGAYLSGRLDKEEYARRVFEYAEEEDIEYMNPERISEKGVEDILVDMGILVRGRKREEESTE
eukprot:jgi/Antlo1/2414/551